MRLYAEDITCEIGDQYKITRPNDFRDYIATVTGLDKNKKPMFTINNCKDMDGVLLQDGDYIIIKKI